MRNAYRGRKVPSLALASPLGHTGGMENNLQKSDFSLWAIFFFVFFVGFGFIPCQED